MTSMPSEPKLSILLPVRNEPESLPIAVRILNAIVDVPHEILVVHDHPNDTTLPVAVELMARFPNLRIVHNVRGPGVANAITAGVHASRGDYVLIHAVDEIAPIPAIEAMVDLLDAGCEFVSANRYTDGGRRLGGSWVGGWISWAANKTFRLIAGGALHDSTTGIKMFRRDVFDGIEFESRPVGWSCVFELAIKAQLRGLRLGEVPIVSVDRITGGRSTFRLWPWLVEYARWFAWGWSRLRGPRPIPMRTQDLSKSERDSVPGTIAEAETLNAPVRRNPRRHVARPEHLERDLPWLVIGPISSPAEPGSSAARW